MNIRKFYPLILVVFGLLAAILLAGIFINANARKSVVAKEIQIVERSDMKVWRGIIMGKPAHLIGDYIVFRVEYLTDKQKKSRISVITKPNFKWSQTNSRDFNIGDEILFFQVIFVSEDGEKALFCPVGIHYSKGELK